MPVRLVSNASYLIIGGFGGVGRSICEYLVRQGARNLILISRSARSHDDTDIFLRELKNSGCQVATYSCDVADAINLADVLGRCRQEMPPIKGLIQAAMVLKVAFV